MCADVDELEFDSSPFERWLKQVWCWNPLPTEYQFYLVFVFIELIGFFFAAMVEDENASERPATAAGVQSAQQETVDAMRDGNQSLHDRLVESFATRLESLATRLNAIVDAALEPSPRVGVVTGLRTRLSGMLSQTFQSGHQHQSVATTSEPSETGSHED